MKIVRRYSLRVLLLGATAACVAAAEYAAYLPRGGHYTDDEA